MSATASQDPYFKLKPSGHPPGGGGNGVPCPESWVRLSPRCAGWAWGGRIDPVPCACTPRWNGVTKQTTTTPATHQEIGDDVLPIERFIPSRVLFRSTWTQFGRSLSSGITSAAGPSHLRRLWRPRLPLSAAQRRWLLGSLFGGGVSVVTLRTGCGPRRQNRPAPGVDAHSRTAAHPEYEYSPSEPGAVLHTFSGKVTHPMEGARTVVPSA